MKIIIIDNYDSFTYNLVQYLQSLGAEVEVFFNDEITIEKIREKNPHGIVLSPGPGTPLNSEDVGICADVIRDLSTDIPVLGVCLGHQLIGHIFGAKVISVEPRHGEASLIRIVADDAFLSPLRTSFSAMRYHSLALDAHDFPQDLRITAESEEGIIMALEHVDRPLYGVQFHPESIGTPDGKKILSLFLQTLA